MSPGRPLLFALVALTTLLFSLQFSTVTIGLPIIIQDLDAPLRWVGWIITAFILAQAISMPVVGKLSDEVGRRAVFVGGLATFTVASLVCALSPNIYVLIAARAAQGLGGGALVTSSFGIVADAFPEEATGAERARAIGLLSAVYPIGAIIGPNLGGFIIEHFGWRWTFALNVPFGSLGVLAALALLLPASTARRPERIDFLGAALFTVAATSLIYSLTELSQREADPNPLVVAICLLLAIVVIAAFVRREWAIPNPAVDLRLLKQKEFVFFTILHFFFGVAIFGFFSFIPLYAQSAYGMSSGKIGVLLTPRAAVLIASSALASLLLARTGYRRPVIGGLMIIAVSLIVLSMGRQEPLIFPDFFYLALVISVGGFGLGVAMPASNNLGLELAPDRIAAISGLRGMLQFLGGSIGTAVIVLVTSHASSTAQGLETSFIGLAVVSVLVGFLVLGIPEGVRARGPAALAAEGTVSALGVAQERESR